MRTIRVKKILIFSNEMFFSVSRILRDNIGGTTNSEFVRSALTNGKIFNGCRNLYIKSIFIRRTRERVCTNNSTASV